MTTGTIHVTSPVHSERLAAKAARGCEKSLGELFERHDHQLLAFIYRQVSQAAVQDIAQAVWLRVTANIGGYVSRGEGSFVAWLFTIAKRLILDDYRNEPRRPAVTPDLLLVGQPCPDAGPEEQVLRRERAQQVTDALAGLPPKQRQCLTLRYFDGLSEAETAEVMEVTVGSVKQYTYRGKKKLCKSLGPVMLTSFTDVATSVSPRTALRKVTP